MGDKSFQCSKEGCRMNFTNEDNFTNHQRQHISLNLALISRNDTSDQTPTPTRFIRNCEEVGLFQDLQNVNPFEETFKKAVELSKNGIQHKPAEKCEDTTLHTPHITPHIPKVPSPSSDVSEDTEFTIPENVLKLRVGEYQEEEVKEDSPKIVTARKRLRKPESSVNIYDSSVPQSVRRREMNRMAQARSRQRKKLVNEEFEQEVRALKSKNATLELENARLKMEVEMLKKQLARVRGKPAVLRKPTKTIPVNILPAVNIITVPSVVLATRVKVQQANEIKIENIDD